MLWEAARCYRDKLKNKIAVAATPFAFQHKQKAACLKKN